MPLPDWLTAASIALLAALFGSALVCIGLVMTKHHHGHLTLDSHVGVQKMHVNPTPRVGGVGIYLGVVLAASLVHNSETALILQQVLLAGVPALLFGLLEDLTKRASVRARLLATIGSGILAWAYSGVALTRVNVPGVDALFVYAPVAVMFTAFAVGGVANAINIIDGFHGLASGTAIIALTGLALIATRSDDLPLAMACLLMAGSLLGFWLLNYPWGQIFLGDGGAYFSGFALGWFAILLPMRNPEVSVWAGLVVCAYPVIEVLYSMLRRRARRKRVGEPDNQHLHSLIKTEVVRKRMPKVKPNLQNASVAPVMWGYAMFCSLLAIPNADNSVVLAIAFGVCWLVYHMAYSLLGRGGGR